MFFKPIPGAETMQIGLHKMGEGAAGQTLIEGKKNRWELIILGTCGRLLIFEIEGEVQSS